MNFLFVIDSVYNPNAGAGGTVITIGNELSSRGHKIAYIWRKENRFIKSNNFYRFFELPYDQYKQIKEALKKEKYDVVMVSQPFAFLAFFLLKPKYSNILFVNRSHGWELRIHQRLKLIGNSTSKKWKSFKNIPAHLLIKFCSYLTVRYSDLILTASSDDKDFIMEAYPKYAYKVESILYGLSDDYIGLKYNEFSINNKIKFLFVGQYVERKGILDLMQIFKNLNYLKDKFELTFIVNDGSIDNVTQDFSFLGASLKVYGWMEREKLVDFYNNSHIFLMPSYGEGFGKTTTEAMACGLCVLGYREAALKDIGVNGENALLVSVGDLEGLEKLTKEIINGNLNLNKLSYNAWNSVQNLTWENSIDSMNEILMNYLNRY